MLPIEISQPSWRVQVFNAASSDKGLQINLDKIEEVRDQARINSEVAKRKIEARYKTKIKPRAFLQGDLVLRKAHPLQLEHKHSPKWTGPFRIKQALRKGTYHLETLEGARIPCTWNARNLRFFFS